MTFAVDWASKTIIIYRFFSYVANRCDKTKQHYEMKIHPSVAGPSVDLSNKYWMLKRSPNKAIGNLIG